MTAITVPAGSGPVVPAPSRRIGPLTGLRNTFTLTWRSVLKIRTNMEDVIGLSLQPIMFLILFTYVFGGAIAHGSNARVPAVRAAGPARDDRGVRHLGHRADAEPGHLQRGLRPVPQPADRPVGTARRRR